MKLLEYLKTSYGITLDERKIDFVNINLDKDTLTFIDPFKLARGNSTLCKRMQTKIVEFFENMLKDIARGKGGYYLDAFHEVSAIRFGLSTNSSFDGKGLGYEIVRNIIHSISSSNAINTLNIQDLENLSIFIPGLGPDRISDLISNIIIPELVEFTQSECVKMNIPMLNSQGFKPKVKYFDSITKGVKPLNLLLPYDNYQNKNRPIIFVPKFAVNDEHLVLNGSYDYYRLGILNHIMSTPSIFVQLIKDTFDKDISKKDTDELLRKNYMGATPGTKIFAEEYIDKFDPDSESLEIYKRNRIKSKDNV